MFILCSTSQTSFCVPLFRKVQTTNFPSKRPHTGTTFLITMKKKDVQVNGIFPFLHYFGVCFFNLSNIDIWGGLILCFEGLSCAFQDLAAPQLLLTSCQQHLLNCDEIVSDIAKFASGGQTPFPVEDHWFICFTKKTSFIVNILTKILANIFHFDFKWKVKPFSFFLGA